MHATFTSGKNKQKITKLITTSKFVYFCGIMNSFLKEKTNNKNQSAKCLFVAHINKYFQEL